MRWKMLAMALLLASQSGHAAGLKVWPVKVSLWPERTTESVNLNNEGDEPINLQISALSWDIDENGEFLETDTGDFVFFPRILTVPPHEEKVLRVGYQGDFPKLEKPYRLIIQELPPVRDPATPEADKASTGVNYVLRLSLPLFVMPGEEPPAPDVAVNGVRTSEGKVQVGVEAPGTHHIEITKVEASLLGNGGQTLANGENPVRMLRVLPQRRVFVDLPLDARTCVKARSLRVKVHAEGLDAPYEQTVELVGGGCLGAS